MKMKSMRSCTMLSVLIMISFIALTGCNKENVSFSTEYQAVFMNNGQVFFGKIQNANSDYPLLRDVFYIGRQASPDGKEVRNILMKRGGEWHGPEFMYINKQHIALIEPVSPSSKLAQLIKEAGSQKPQEPTKP